MFNFGISPTSPESDLPQGNPNYQTLVKVKFEVQVPWDAILFEPVGSPDDPDSYCLLVWSGEIVGNLAVGETVTIKTQDDAVYMDGGDQRCDFWVNGSTAVIVDIETETHIL